MTYTGSVKIRRGILDNPVIGLLPDNLWRPYIEIQLIADDDGLLPDEDEIAWWLHRHGAVELGVMLKQLATEGLIEWSQELQRWYIPDFSETQQSTVAISYPDNWSDLRKLIFDRDNHICLYCGNPATHVDHIVPVSRGGQHVLSNLVSACARCNISKSNHSFYEWYQSQSFYDKRKSAHIRRLNRQHNCLNV